MQISRRHLLAVLTAAGLVPAGRANADTPAESLLISSVDTPDGAHALTAHTLDGTRLFSHSLPDRGHGSALHPLKPEVVMMARRPGTFLRAVDLCTGVITAEAESPSGRHFYGHAAFSADGRILYATENDYDNAAGAIALYDTAEGYRRIGEWDGLETGPHELMLMPDERSLVVTIGGIQTHPDHEREKLNLPSMAPALAYFDTADGSMRFRTALPPELHQLSIRHVDVAADGRVAICMQYEGAERDRMPLVGIQQDEGPIRLLEMPERVMRRTANYAGSVRLDSSGRVVATTCPRGNLVLFWDIAEDDRFLGWTSVFDGCGLSATGVPGQFVIASGGGGLTLVDALAAGGPSATAVPPNDADQVYWDNHMLGIFA